MILRQARRAALASAAAGLLLAGCNKIEDRMGYVVDDALITAIQPGVDNKDSVIGTLGRPSFTSTFDENEWYYVSRTTKNFAFRQPNPDAQTVLRVRFDANGNVASVDRRGLEQVVSINPMGDKTPTLGRDKSIWEELFGNIGAVGSGAATGQTGPNN